MTRYDPTTRLGLLEPPGVHVSYKSLKYAWSLLTENSLAGVMGGTSLSYLFFEFFGK